MHQQIQSPHSQPPHSWGSHISAPLSTCHNHPRARYQTTRDSSYSPRGHWNHPNQPSLRVLIPALPFLPIETSMKTPVHVSLSSSPPDQPQCFLVEPTCDMIIFFIVLGSVRVTDSLFNGRCLLISWSLFT